MAEIVHHRRLDRSKPFGTCIGTITDDVHFEQDGYGFDAQGNCVKVTEAAPDYEKWRAGWIAALQQPPADDADQDPTPPAETADVPSPCAPVRLSPEGAPLDPPPPPAAQPDPTPPPAESGDEGAADDQGPIDPDLPWNELQARMKARGLPRPQNKEDALRILQEAGMAP